MKTKLDIIQADDEMFGNKQRTTIGSTTYDGRPRQFYGVHALVEQDGKIYLCSEDDGHFIAEKDLTIKEIYKLHHVLSKVSNKFTFDDYKPIFNTKNMRTKYKVTDSIYIVIDNYSHDSVMMVVAFDSTDRNLGFSAYWLRSLVKVLDIKE